MDIATVPLIDTPAEQEKGDGADSGPTVFLLDDDESFVCALECLLRAEGFATRTWASAKNFLAEHDSSQPGCLVSEMFMHEMSGLELQRELLAQGCTRPIVFITGRNDMASAVEGMKRGAVTFLPKPVPHDSLFSALREAFCRDTTERARCAEQHRVRDLVNSLTPREGEVLEMLVQGLLNKQIASALGMAEKTVKVHRGRVMEKMHVRSAAALALLLNQDDRLRRAPVVGHSTSNRENHSIVAAIPGRSYRCEVNGMKNRPKENQLRNQ